MKSLEYNTGEKGLGAVLKDWEEAALKVLWRSKAGLNSRQVWQKVNEKLSPETISRASIINFLEDIREMGILSGVQETGKGGYHLVYSPVMDESGLRKHIAETLISCLTRDFPEETKNASKNVS